MSDTGKNMDVRTEEVKGEIWDDNGEDRMTLRLSKEYSFEGETYTKIDLWKLEELTAADMIAANRQLTRNGNLDIVQEMSLEYACVLAAQATKLPVEFYKGLPPKDAMKLKNRVTGFLYGSE